MRILFIILAIVTLTMSARAGAVMPPQDLLNPTGKSLGITLITQETTLGVGQIILTGKVRLNGRNITAAAPDTGPFTVPCGLPQGDLVLNLQLIAERLKFKGKDVKFADLKVMYSTGGGYREASFDEYDGWFASIPLDQMQPDVKVISFDVLYKSGRTYVKLLGLVTIHASDSKNRVQAARTMAFAEYDGPADRETVWRWQVLMGGATLTGQALPAGGVAPLFTPQSVKDQLYQRSGGHSESKPNDSLRISKQDADDIMKAMDTEEKTSVSPVMAPKAEVKPEAKKPAESFDATEVMVDNTKFMRVTASEPIEVHVRYGSSVRKQALKKGESLRAEITDDLKVTVYFKRNGKTLTQVAAARQEEN